MHKIRDFSIDVSELAYWEMVGIVTLLVFHYGLDLPLYLLLVPVALVALGALIMQRWWYGLALGVGVTALVFLPLYLSVSEGF